MLFRGPGEGPGTCPRCHLPSSRPCSPIERSRWLWVDSGLFSTKNGGDPTHDHHNDPMFSLDSSSRDGNRVGMGWDGMGWDGTRPITAGSAVSCLSLVFGLLEKVTGFVNRQKGKEKYHFVLKASVEKKKKTNKNTITIIEGGYLSCRRLILWGSGSMPAS